MSADWDTAVMQAESMAAVQTRKPPPPRERFDRFVDRTGGDNACWPWRGRQRTPDGFPAFSLANHQFAAHRLAWQFANTRPATHELVRHRCGEKLCCNPAHLFLMSRKTLTNRRWDADRAARFWRDVQRGSAEECWPWMRVGRAAFVMPGIGFLGERQTTPWRTAYALVRGTIPPGHRIYRRTGCDARCCNPDHMVAKRNLPGRRVTASAPHRSRTCRDPRGIPKWRAKR